MLDQHGPRVVTLLLLLGAASACSSSPAQAEAPPPTIRRAALGVSTSVPTQELSDELELTFEVRREGRHIDEVALGSAAERAGLLTGDVLLSLDGMTLYSQDDLTDFLAVSQPGKSAALVYKRRGSRAARTLQLELGSESHVAATEPSLHWQFASLAQLPDALAQARSMKKKVLVGLSGAETWWPSTRFESGALSTTLNDPAVLQAADAFVRVIVRRPHAYFFVEEHVGAIQSATPSGCRLTNGASAPLPGIYFLDGEGTYLESVGLNGTDAARQLSSTMRRLSRKDWRMRSLLGILLVLVLGACATTPASELRPLSLHVEGFVELSGITWLGWPNKVLGALEGHPAITEVTFDIEQERFELIHDAQRLDARGVLQLVRELGFEPVDVTDRPLARPSADIKLALDDLPPRLATLFADALAHERPVLLDFTAPGWSTCERMDAVTYPAPQVRAELQHWSFQVVDVTQHPGVAAQFGVTAVPTAVAVEGDLVVLDRRSNFVEPDAFRAWLHELREAR